MRHRPQAGNTHTRPCAQATPCPREVPSAGPEAHRLSLALAGSPGVGAEHAPSTPSTRLSLARRELGTGSNCDGILLCFLYELPPH